MSAISGHTASRGGLRATLRSLPFGRSAIRHSVALWVGVGVLLVGLTAALLAILFATAVRERTTALEAAETLNHSRAEIAVEAVGALVGRADATLRDVGFRVSMELAGTAGLPLSLADSVRQTMLLDPAIATITVHDKDGRLIVGTPDNRPLPASIGATQLFADHARLWADFRIGRPEPVEGYTEPMVPFSRRVDSAQGRLLAIVTAWMPVDALYDAFKLGTLPPAAAIGLSDPRGQTVLAAWRSGDGVLGRGTGDDIPGSLRPPETCGGGIGDTTVVTRCGSFRIDTLRLPNSAHGISQVTDLTFTLDRWEDDRLVPTVTIAAGIAGVVAALVAIMSVTARRLQASQTALDDQRNRLTAIVNSAPDGIMSVGQDLRIEDANPAAAEIFGYAPGDLIGRPLSILVPAERVETHDIVASDFLRSEGTVGGHSVRSRAVQGRRRGGEAITVQIGLARTTIGGRPQVIAVVADLSEQERGRQQLAEKNKIISAQLHQLKEANAAKNRFLSAMSHELRTPLNAIIGFSDLLRSGADELLPGEKRLEYVGYIHESGEHLLSLINDILDVSRVEERGASLSSAPVDTGAVLEALSHLMAPILQKAKLRLSLEIAPDLPRASGDERAIKQIVMNLISNAAKFTQPGGRVRVVAASTASHICISVEDSGIGIPADRIALLGRPFQQVGDHWSGSATGLGLGLALTKMLTEEMGGRLLIESEEGAWTRVSFTLPLAEHSVDGPNRRQIAPVV